MLTQSAPLAKTAAALRSGELDLKTYLNQLLDRLEEVDAQVQALLPEENRRARLLQEADALAARYPNPAERPPLYGIPVGVKDIYRVDGFPTKAGSNVPPEALAGAEASSVTRLKNAGALILGKTVTTEFAYFEPGPTRNPHNLAHTPGGSSSGSAAAVAAGYCLLALGTQTIGSIVRPAAFCGVVGYKPSYNRSPSDGLLYVSRSLDHAGPFTQDVAGMALTASILCQDWQPAEVDTLPVLGVPEGAYLQQAEPEALQAFEAQLKKLQSAGYEVRRIPAMDDIEEISENHIDLMAGEMAREYAELYPKYKDLFRPRTVWLVEKGQQVSDERLEALKITQAELRQRLQTQMQEASVDLWVAPAAPGPAPEGLNATGSPAMNLPWTQAGMPALTVPAGKAANNLPLGFQMIAPYWQDEKLIAWAEAVAQTLREE